MRLTISGSPSDIGDALRGMAGQDGDARHHGEVFAKAVRELALQGGTGRKIQAIKLYHEYHGCGHVAAKEAVERLC